MALPSAGFGADAAAGPPIESTTTPPIDSASPMTARPASRSRRKTRAPTATSSGTTADTAPACDAVVWVTAFVSSVK